MNPFEDVPLRLQNKYTCEFTIAAAVVGVAAGVTSIVNSGGGSSGGGGGGSAGGGGSGMPSFNPGNPTIQSQQTPTLQATQAAKSAYDPGAAAQAWSNIFQNMPTSKETTEVPDIKTPPSDPSVQSNQSNTSPV